MPPLRTNRWASCFLYYHVGIQVLRQEKPWSDKLGPGGKKDAYKSELNDKDWRLAKENLDYPSMPDNTDALDISFTILILSKL